MKAQDLKNSILQMAMEGKLVPQDPNDEPASVLLERIKEEKERLIKEKKIKRNNKESFIFRKNNHFYEKVGKNEPICIDGDIPWEIPDNWEWCKHPFLFEISGGSQPAKSKFSDEPKEGYIRLYQIRDYGPKPLPVYIPLESAKKVSKKGDIMLARYGGSLGKVFWAEDGAYNVAIAKVILLFDEKLIDKEFLFLFYLSDLYQSFVKSRSSGRSAQAGFNKNDLNNLFFPLPPLNEQKRIVSKYKEIEPYFKNYETFEEELTKLNKEFPSKIKDSILQDAIQGKLVPQDPDDEPATVLLERIMDEKERLIKEKKIKRNKNESFIFKENNHFYEKIGNENPICIDDEIPFEIPEQWGWTRIKNISEFVTKGTTPKGGKSAYTNHGIKFLRVENIGKNGELLLNNIKYISEDTHHNFLKRSILKEYDLLISIAGALGRTAIVPKNVLPLNTNQAVSFVRWYNTELIYVPYIEKAINSPEIQKLLLKQSKITAIPNLTLEIIRECLIPIPPLEEQKRIFEMINKLFEELNI